MRPFKTYICVVMVVWTASAGAQEFPYHYFSHAVPVTANPSLVAATSDMEVAVGAYNLWAGGFKPVNDYLVSIAMSPDYFRRRNFRRNSTRIGVGLNLLNDRTGPFNHYILQLIYAYHIPLSRDVQLSLGVAGIVENINIDVGSLSPGQPDDPRLMNGNNLAFLFDGGFGATVRTEDFMLALSVVNMASGAFRFSEQPAEEFPVYRKYFLNGSYTFGISHTFTVQPHLTLRNSPLQRVNFDASLNMSLHYFYVGAGYRGENALFFFVTVPVGNFSFSYTSENPLNANPMIGNGHTLSVGWRL